MSTYVAPSREGKVNMAIWTDEELRLEFKRVALELNRPVNELAEEALRRDLPRLKRLAKERG